MRKFTMPFEPMTIEHLGLRLYSTLPPVISELVSNAYDAESPKVEVCLPVGVITRESEVVVRDFGHGLTEDELQTEFLPIGRNRRGSDSTVTVSKNGKRRVTGRKGLGKLSPFGIAGEIEVRSIHDGNCVCLLLNYDEMMAWGKTHPREPFEPQVVEARTGSTDEASGVEITIRKFHRRNPISADLVRKGLARRLNLIGDDFQVFLNGDPVTAADRLKKSDCSPGFSWEISEIPETGNIDGRYKVTGWLGFLGESSQTERGIDIFASGKAVELGSFFNHRSTHAQFARAHLVGQINAEFLDEVLDLASTGRNSVVWESEIGQLLEQWGQKAIIWAFGEWLRLRREKKAKDVVRAARFDEWLATQSTRDQRIARKMLDALVEDPKIDPESAIPLLEIVKSSVESVSFRELVNDIDEKGASLALLLELFKEWRIIEAREHLKLADGRLAAITKLKKFIDEGALEVTELQPLFVKNIWLIEPTWTEAEVQPTYTKLLRDNCKEAKGLDEKDRRLDILGITAGGTLTVVELKRPEKTLSRKDLEQIEAYVDWMRTYLGTGPDVPKYVNGLLIVGKMARSADIHKKQQRLAGDDIRVESFNDLYERSRKYYGMVDRRLKSIAPEYSRSKRSSRVVV